MLLEPAGIKYFKERANISNSDPPEMPDYVIFNDPPLDILKEMQDFDDLCVGLYGKHFYYNTEEFDRLTGEYIDTDEVKKQKHLAIMKIKESMDDD